MSFASGVLLVLLASSLSAQDTSRAGTAERGGVFVIAGEISHETYGLYLVDYTNKVICVYRYDAGNRNLRLMAARTYEFDVELDAYNVGEPSPSRVMELISRQNRLGEMGAVKGTNEIRGSDTTAPRRPEERKK